MEKYINDRTIVKNDIFKSIKDEIICLNVNALY